MTELITIEGVEKSYFTPAGELKVLKRIDGSFRKGEVVSIMGISGAGKSSFLHILGTLDRPTAGRITYHTDNRAVDPFSLNDRDLAAFRNKVVGFIFQFHYLLPEFTALENVMMPGLISRRQKTEVRRQMSEKELRERAELLLDELGLSARKDHRPGELSGGEQQRVAVARALLLEPAVVLADEPTGNLDSSTGEDLFKLLLDINERKGTTFIIVTHNYSLSRQCHRTLRMADGSLLSAS
ncbi:MAG: ABC transporter ATP-binding protein [Nitrospirales bacterium]|nr:ABC transporter ATP-binding protein [Nitrospirales bacterium]